MSRFHLTFIFALSVLSAAGLAQAADLPVANDAEAAAALAKATPGDTVTLASGDYHGGWVLPPGAPDKPITLRAAHPGQVFIICTKITDTPAGVQMADHTRVEGLAFTGFVSGMLAKVHSDVTVADCVFYSNRSGVVFTKCKQGRVERCSFHSNPAPNAIRGVQLVVNRGGEGIVWEHNLIETVSPDEPEGGIFLEDGTHYTDCAVRWNVFAGPSKNSLVLDAPDADAVVVEHNVGLAMLSGGTQKFNTCAAVEPDANKNDTQIVGLEEKKKFVDPTYLDYRLQPDSPVGATRESGAIGALPRYKDYIYYVDPAAGDDAATGFSRAAAWKTLSAVAAKLTPAFLNHGASVTLYLLPGSYNGPLTITGLHNTADKPVIVRAYGKAKLNIEAIIIKDCQNLRLENLQTSRLVVDNSGDIVISHCTVAKGQGATLTRNNNVEINHCAFWGSKDEGLHIGEHNEGGSITSSVLVGNMGIEALTKTPYMRFNLGLPGGPPFDATRPADDAKELNLPPSAPLGRYAQPIGP